ncbi:MAG TPA: gluconate 2-dehydrogenase subunit 3 family protein [Terriglobales bacterium]|nr:gluconate 2-dehydrogenase subunit 3 family protein [Terriglobales bacterium]
MDSNQISRRVILKSLSMGTLAGSVLSVIPAQAAELAHKMIAAEKANSANGAYTPKFFSAPQYKTLQNLCETIFPADSDSGGAGEAGAPEFIDLLTSENADYQLTLGGGLLWLESTCGDRYGNAFLNCTAAQQKEMLDLIAYSKNGVTHPEISQGVAFFALLRILTADAFFTSKIGIQYLGYIGNTFLTEFPGCPPVPEA